VREFCVNQSCTVGEPESIWARCDAQSIDVRFEIAPMAIFRISRQRAMDAGLVGGGGFG